MALGLVDALRYPFCLTHRVFLGSKIFIAIDTTSAGAQPPYLYLGADATPVLSRGKKKSSALANMCSL